MSDSKEVTGAEVAQSALDKLDSYFAAAQEVIEKYGGDAVELGLMALRIEAASSLVYGILAAIMIYPAYKLYRYLANTADTFDGEMVAIVFGTISGILIIFGLSRLFDLWAWIGIFYPEIYAVHKFLL